MKLSTCCKAEIKNIGNDKVILSQCTECECFEPGFDIVEDNESHWEFDENGDNIIV